MNARSLFVGHIIPTAKLMMTIAYCPKYLGHDTDKQVNIYHPLANQILSQKHQLTKTATKQTVIKKTK